MTFFPLALIVSLLSFSSTYSNGFSVDLFPRDSPKSPMFNSSLTHFDRIGHALRRSLKRHNHFAASVVSLDAVGGTTSPIVAGGGEYLMKIKLGTPPVDIVAIADTGSDLVWTQCSPCTSCFKQTAPLFDPKRSTTYSRVPCESESCSTETRSSCSNRGCSYQMSYGDNSFSQGDLSNDTIGLGSSASDAVTHKGLVFGCGQSSAGTFMKSSSGIIGLGGGKVSLIAQMDEVIQGKFSYCLMPLGDKTTSAMHFGVDATVAGAGVVSTPLIPKNPSTFYYLTIEGITVGSGKRLEIKEDSYGDYNDVETTGNIIIDSGTTLTYLPQNLYSNFESAVKDAIRLTPTSDPLRLLDVCYATSSVEGLPDITVHFAGADVKLPPLNSFVMTSNDVTCLAFRPAGPVAIYGNIAQINFLVGYDLKKKTVSFKPTNCGQ